MDVNFATDCICLQVWIIVLVGVDMFPFWQDMFPQTGTEPDINQKVSCHVETVCFLSNTQKKKESYVTLDVEMDDYYRIKGEGKSTK